MVGAAVRYCGFDRGAQRAEAIGQFRCPDIGPDRRHAAADVDADRGGDDRTHGRNDAADRRPHSPMHVRHDRDMLMDKRQARDILDLLARGVLDRHAARPRLDRRAAGLDVFEPAHVLLLSAVPAPELPSVDGSPSTPTDCNNRGR